MAGGSADFAASLTFPNDIAAKLCDLGATRKREHSRKPDEQYDLIEACSRGPFLELFARGTRPGWTYWGNQADDDYRPTWATYAHNSSSEKQVKTAKRTRKRAEDLFEPAE